MNNSGVGEKQEQQTGILPQGDTTSRQSKNFVPYLPPEIDFMVEGQFMLTSPKQIMERMKLGASQSALTRKLSQPKFKRSALDVAGTSPLKLANLNILDDDIYGTTKRRRYHSNARGHKQSNRAAKLKSALNDQLVEHDESDLNSFTLKF